MREDHRLRVFESRMQRKMFGSERGGVTGEWRRMRSEVLYDALLNK
jgi:hypothetical protein